MTAPATSEQPAPPAAESVSGSQLAMTLLGDTAAVSAPAVSQAEPPAAAETSEFPPDSLGRKFDAVRFRTKPDGSPFLNAKGAFMPRGGRKPGRATAPATETAPRVSFVPPLPNAPKPADPAPASSGAAVPPVPPPAPSPASRTAIEQTAEAYLRTGYTAADAVFGGKGEWQPDDAAEHAAMKEPLAEYLHVSGAQPLPPWARFAVALVSFAAKRFGRPATKQATAGWFSKVNGAKPVAAAAPSRTAQPQPAAHHAAGVLEIEPLPHR